MLDRDPTEAVDSAELTSVRDEAIARQADFNAPPPPSSSPPSAEPAPGPAQQAPLRGSASSASTSNWEPGSRLVTGTAASVSRSSGPPQRDRRDTRDRRDRSLWIAVIILLTACLVAAGLYLLANLLVDNDVDGPQARETTEQGDR